MNRIKEEKVNKIDMTIRAEKNNLSSFLYVCSQFLYKNKKK
jgi:predicted DNA-binding ribbon-helix-helix protein